mgnify:CR=1 FL=1
MSRDVSKRFWANIKLAELCTLTPTPLSLQGRGAGGEGAAASAADATQITGVAE